MSDIFMGTGSAGSITISNSGFAQVYTTPAESEVTVVAFKSKGFSPRIYMKYVKSRFSLLERKDLDERIDKLKLMLGAVKDFPEDIEQKALYENLSKALVLALQESELFVCGYKKYIDIKIVEKYKKVQDKVVKFEHLNKYPRIIPPAIRKVILDTRNKKLFDQYWVLYTDYTDEKLKTNKEKIIEKDPIIFGAFSFNPGRLYYIIDWEDEFCNLTLDRLIDEVKEEDLSLVGEIKEIDAAFIEQIRQEVLDRQKRLDDTNVSNWQAKAKEEDKKIVIPKKQRVRDFLRGLIKAIKP